MLIAVNDSPLRYSVLPLIGYLPVEFYGYSPRLRYGYRVTLATPLPFPDGPRSTVTLRTVCYGYLRYGSRFTVPHITTLRFAGCPFTFVAVTRLYLVILPLRLDWLIYLPVAPDTNVGGSHSPVWTTLIYVGVVRCCC